MSDIYLSKSSELSTLQQWKDAGIVQRSIGDVSVKFKSTPSSLDRVGGFLGSNAFRYISKFLDRNVRTGRT